MEGCGKVAAQAVDGDCMGETGRRPMDDPFDPAGAKTMPVTGEDQSRIRIGAAREIGLQSLKSLGV